MVDVLLATYNGERFLEEQLKTLLNQTCKDFKIFIRDDGSTDGTLSIIQKYVNSYPDIFFLVCDDKKCGSATKNFLELAKHSTSDYAMFCDQDDYWLPDKIQKSLEAIKNVERDIGFEKPILVYGNYVPVDADLKKIKVKEKHLQVYSNDVSLNKLLVQNYVTGCLSIINRQLCKMLGEFDTRIQMHDWWAALIASSLGKLEHINDCLMYYRQHGGNVVGATNVRSLKYFFSKVNDKKVKQSQSIYENQGRLLLERFDGQFNEHAKKTIETFISISSTKGKIKRIRMLRKGHYLKRNLSRRLGQYFYI